MHFPYLSIKSFHIISIQNNKKEKVYKTPTYSQLYPLAKHILWIVILTASLSTFIDYQFKIEIGLNIQSEEEMMRFFGHFYTLTGIVSIIIQLFLSGRILSFLVFLLELHLIQYYPFLAHFSF